MHIRKATLDHPLQIDVKKIASYFPEFRYRGPFTSDFPKQVCTSEYILNDANSDKMEVLLFEDYKEGGFTTIISEYSPRELAALFIRLPTPISLQLEAALKDSALEIPPMSSSELSHHVREAEKERKKDEEFKQLQAPLKNAKEVDFKKSQSVGVIQHEYAVTTATSERPIVGTFGASTCVILALYDESKKTAVLAHVDSLTSPSSLNRIFNLISKEHTVAHLAGGSGISINMCLSIVEMLKRNKIKIVNADLCQCDFDGASLAIDARTGNIYSPVDPSQLEKGSDLDIRLQLAGLQFMETPIHRYIFKPSLKSKPELEEDKIAPPRHASNKYSFHNTRGLKDFSFINQEIRPLSLDFRRLK